MKIGLTVLVKQDESPFKNGIMQNAAYLYETLQNLDFVEEVTFLQCDINEKLDLNKKHAFSDYNFKFFHPGTIPEIKKDYRLIICIGASIPPTWAKEYKKDSDNKIVSYKGGNEFVNEMESVIYGQIQGHPKINLNKGKREDNAYDEVWYVPQQEYHNRDYLEIRFGVTSKPVPFLWSPKFIDPIAKKFKEKGEDPLFENKTIDKWCIASMEPNMSLLKNMMPIIYSAEYAYNKYDYVKENIDQVMITNSISFHEVESLVNIVSNLNLFKDKKITFDDRYTLVYILAKQADIIVSHQWGNPLNYAYLDACYFGAPLIHNATLCKDLGYYYDEFKLKNCAKLINRVMQERQKDAFYTKRQRDILKRYLPDNDKVVEQYGLLIKNLWKKNKMSEYLEYDSLSNLVYASSEKDI